MSNFEDAVIQRIRQLEREVERLQKWERLDKPAWTLSRTLGLMPLLPASKLLAKMYATSSPKEQRLN